MSKVVYKFPIPYVGAEQDIVLPVGATILTFALQGDVPHIWVELNPKTAEISKRYFQIFATGQDIPGDARYIGTIFPNPYVFHLYEIIK